MNAKAVMPRGAPNGETHRYSASDPQATGHPGAIREDLRVIQVTRRFGAPFPSLGKGKRDGLSRARIKTGTGMALAILSSPQKTLAISMTTVAVREHAESCE